MQQIIAYRNGKKKKFYPGCKLWIKTLKAGLTGIMQ